MTTVSFNKNSAWIRGTINCKHTQFAFTMYNICKYINKYNNVLIIIKNIYYIREKYFYIFHRDLLSIAPYLTQKINYFALYR